MLPQKEIESSSVLRLIQQYLHENGLQESLHSLQQETGVALSGIDGNALETICQSVTNGQWDVVLRRVQPLALPRPLVRLLYEQIFYELAAGGQWNAAKHLANESPAMLEMRDHEPTRYANVLRVLGAGPAELLRNGGSALMSMGSDPARRRIRREEIANGLREVLDLVPKSRLLTLLGQSLKWQQYQGLMPWSSTSYDLYMGVDASAPGRSDKEDVPPRAMTGKVRLGKKSYPTVASFSYDGAWLVTGSVDGFIEVWDPNTCKHRIDLEYQQKQEMMMHENTILSLAFSPDSEMVASGCAAGEIKIWKIRTGTLLVHYPSAHSGPIKGLCFGMNGTHVYSGSTDGTARLHGLRSGNTLRDYTGHAGEVTCVTLSRRKDMARSSSSSSSSSSDGSNNSDSSDGERLITGSIDGTVRVWNTRTATCLRVFTTTQLRPPNDEEDQERDDAGITYEIYDIRTIPKLRSNEEHVIVCNGTSSIYMLNVETGVVTHAFSCVPSERKPNNFDRITCLGCTSRGQHFQCLVGEKRVVTMDILDDGSLVSTQNDGIKVTEKEKYVCHHIVCHPHRNVMATSGTDGCLRLWSS
jgi:WD40 repeat-containing protein SMU1